MADSTWKTRPPLMSNEVFEAALQRIIQQCQLSRQERFKLAFHGGEPCLIGHQTFDRWCARARSTLGNMLRLTLVMQTNGSLFDRDWMDTLRKHRAAVGLSMDGPKEIHDRVRVDHRQQGSYDRVEQGLKLLQEAEIPYGIGCVIPLGADPLKVHHHFLELGCKQITYLMPHYTHDTITSVRERFGPTPCADFLIPIFDDWWLESTMEIQINDLKDIARVILGGKSSSEAIGNDPPRYVFIEADGEMEGLDNLRACGESFSQIKLNVFQSDFSSLLRTPTMHSQAIFQGMPLSQACRQCTESETCRGGHLAHRYSKASAFDNPSVWCADLLKLFAHLRNRLGVSIDQTLENRRLLAPDRSRRKTLSPAQLRLSPESFCAASVWPKSI